MIGLRRFKRWLWDTDVAFPLGVTLFGCGSVFGAVQATILAYAGLVEVWGEAAAEHTLVMFWVMVLVTVGLYLMRKPR